METILEKLSYTLKREEKVIRNFHLQKDLANWNIGELSNINKSLAWYYFLLGDMDKAKQSFYLLGRCIEYNIIHYNSRIFDYGIPQVAYVLLCDNLPFLQNYFANLSYRGDGKNFPDMEKMVEMGEGAIFCHSILQIVKEDWNMLARNIDILEKKVINKKKNQVLIPDYNFYKAILKKDKVAIEEAINELLTPKMHKKRNNQDLLLNHFVSMPALGYAKLAWLNGIEVEIDNPLVPKEMLPVIPNDKYDDYDFL
jgi:hypothetical protein